jgi:hypothetical protein
VHQPQANPAPQIGARQRPKHMPNHIRARQLPVKAGVVIVGTPADIKPIRLGCKKIEHFLAGNEVGENS